MFGIVGIIVILVMVFGGFILHGGNLEPIIHALPFEMIMIGGAAVGAFLVSNDLAAVKHTAKDTAKVFKGPKWKPGDYRDLLCLLFELIRLARANPVGLEEHIENPHDSAIFGKYPKIQHDHETVDLIADTMRAASMTMTIRIRSKRCWTSGLRRLWPMPCTPAMRFSPWRMLCLRLALWPPFWG